MSSRSRLPVSLFSVVVLCAGAAAAAGVQVSPVTPVNPSGGLVAPLGWTGAVFGPGLAPSLPGSFSRVAGLGFSPLTLPVLPSLAAPKLSPVASMAAVSAAPRAAILPASAQDSGAPRAALSLREKLAVQSRAIAEAGVEDKTGMASMAALDGVFLGDSKAGTVVNDQGIRIYGRALNYYQQIRKLVEKLESRTDLKESLDVMDDSYGDAWAKLRGIEAIAAQRSVAQHNTHLDGTLLWVDGVLRDGGKKVAVNTNRVFFHHSPNPRSEIEEGNRRVDGYLREVVPYFAAGGKADEALGGVDEVVLNFDVRGYAEIKEHIRARAKEISAVTGQRFRFTFLDELIEMPSSEDAIRKQLNTLISRYGKDEGLGKIIEGVVYGRYVGLLLELRTLEHYLAKGYEVLQSGRELFDSEQKYLTELDAVVRDPATGRVSLVEAKSARVPLPFEQVLQDKVVAKLENYSKNRALLTSAIGANVDEVVFSFDVGSNKGLEKYLQAREAELGRKYGFSVKFLFLESSPRPGKTGKSGKQRR